MFPNFHLIWTVTLSCKISTSFTYIVACMKSLCLQLVDQCHQSFKVQTGRLRGAPCYTDVPTWTPKYLQTSTAINLSTRIPIEVVQTSRMFSTTTKLVAEMHTYKPTGVQSKVLKILKHIRNEIVKRSPGLTTGPIGHPWLALHRVSLALHTAGCMHMMGGCSAVSPVNDLSLEKKRRKASHVTAPMPSTSILLNTPSKDSRRPSLPLARDNCMKAAICKNSPGWNHFS